MLNTYTVYNQNNKVKYVTGSAKTGHSRTKQISEISEKQKIWVSEQIVTNDIYIKMHSFTIRTVSFRLIS